jgi:hypothetical protein
MQWRMSYQLCVALFVLHLLGLDDAIATTSGTSGRDDDDTPFVVQSQVLICYCVTDSDLKWLLELNVV